jgi:hypothetical protein
MSGSAAYDNPFKPKPRGGTQAAIAQIREWTRTALGLVDGELVSVTELACAEPGCPPRETVIVVIRAGEPPMTLRVHKAMPDVVRADIDAFRPPQI